MIKIHFFFFTVFLHETLTTKTFISAISVKEKQNKCAFKIKTKKKCLLWDNRFKIVYLKRGPTKE